MVIHISVSGPGSTAKTSLNVKMLTLIKPPPNPVADDRNDSYHMAIRRTKQSCEKPLRWSVWRPWWQEYWYGTVIMTTRETITILCDLTDGGSSA